MNRITDKWLCDNAFPNFIRVANTVGINTDGWYLQRAYGNQYSIKGSDGAVISPEIWVGAGTAYRGMLHMISAWILLRDSQSR